MGKTAVKNANMRGDDDETLQSPKALSSSKIDKNEISEQRAVKGTTAEEDTDSGTTVNRTKRQNSTQDERNSGELEEASTVGGGICGLNEIDNLFSSKKQHLQQVRKLEHQQQQDRKKLKQSSSNTAKSTKIANLNFDRSDMTQLQSGEWAKDGLGGVFNADGYTGRKEAGSGYKIYKAHLFNNKRFGTTKDCPFDCECCYI